MGLSSSRDCVSMCSHAQVLKSQRSLVLSVDSELAYSIIIWQPQRSNSQRSGKKVYLKDSTISLFSVDWYLYRLRGSSFYPSLNQDNDKLMEEKTNSPTVCCRSPILFLLLTAIKSSRTPKCPGHPRHSCFAETINFPWWVRVRFWHICVQNYLFWM